MAGRGIVREKKTARFQCNGTKPNAPVSSARKGVRRRNDETLDSQWNSHQSEHWGTQGCALSGGLVSVVASAYRVGSRADARCLRSERGVRARNAASGARKIASAMPASAPVPSMDAACGRLTPGTVPGDNVIALLTGHTSTRYVLGLIPIGSFCESIKRSPLA
jgi:hypothetical protein